MTQVASLVVVVRRAIARSFNRVSLRTVLIVPFLAQLVGVVTIVVYRSYQTSQESVRLVTLQLRSEVSSRIQQELHRYLEAPGVINQVNRSALQQGQLDLKSTSSLTRQFWNQRFLFTGVNVSAIYLGTVEGEFFGMGFQADGTWQIGRAGKSTNGHFHSYATDSQGNPSRLLEVGKPYDPRLRPWFKKALTANKPVWSDVYIDFKEPRLKLTLAESVRDTQGQLMGVIGTDFVLSHIQTYLRQLEISPSAQIFIVETASGALVASSNSETPYLIDAAGKVSDRRMASDSQVPLIRQTFQYLRDRSIPLTQIQGTEQLTAQINNQQQFLQVTRWQDDRGIDWLIVVVIPAADFMGQIQANLRTTALVSVAALGVAILVGIATARWVIRPILRLNESAKALSQGDWQQLTSSDRTDELGELSRSFERMAHQLQDAFTNLETKNLELQHLNQLKDEFLANTSHELRTPLNGMIGIAESMLDGATGSISEMQRRNLVMIAQSGHRLAKLVNDILDFSKLRHQTIALRFRPVGVREAVEVVLTINQVLISHKSLDLVNAVPADLPPAYADEDRLQQILYNLVGNAIKFTPSGQVTVSATLLETEETSISVDGVVHQSPSQLAVSVIDTGIGIPPDKIDRIFESFEQGDGSTEREYGGTGLGLAVTQKLVELHGGKLTVTSAVGEGSCFTFTLPIAPSTLPNPAPPPALKEEASLTPSLTPIHVNQGDHASLATTTSLISIPDITDPLQESLNSSQIKILIVDDEPVNLQVLVNHLSFYDYYVVQANNGEEAIALIKSGFRPDLILLDVMMPKMTGYEVTRVLRETLPADQLPIVLLSAKTQVEDMVAGLDAGANDYLAKPISKDELLARIRTHLHIRELEAETIRLVLESEQRLTQFLDAIPVGIFVADNNGKPYYINQCGQTILGQGLILEAEDLRKAYGIYQAGSEQLYPRDRDPVLNALQERRVTVEDMEVRRDNLIIPIEVWGTPIYDGEGTVKYAIAAFLDITQRKQAEAERQQFIEQLYTANANLEAALDSELRLAEAAGRFVPNQFIAFLGYDSIVDAQIGDAVAQSMSILFSDIRNFTTMSETMTPEDSFQFINTYLCHMEPAITEHQGFIDKYIGDAIMALFAGQADDAVQAGITMLNRLQLYNQSRQTQGRSPIQIGIGINTGPVVLGTVGGQNRMDGTVIGDTVNLASRVETLTKSYQAPLLITQYTMEQLANPNCYAMRQIDWVTVKGKSQPVRIFEVFEADEPTLKAEKLTYQSWFEEAVNLQSQQRFDQAVPLFEQYLDKVPDDRTAQVLLNRCLHQRTQSSGSINDELPKVH